MASDSSKLKVADLRSELRSLGLSQAGLKAELVARLDEALNSVVSTTDAISTSAEADEPKPQAPFEQGHDVSHSQTDTLDIDPPGSPEPSKPTAETVLSSSYTHATAQSSVAPNSAGTSVTPAPTEIRQDYQTRHRRSASPLPPKLETHTLLRTDDEATGASNFETRLDDNDTAMHEPEGIAQGGTRGGNDENAEMQDAPAPRVYNQDAGDSDVMDSDVESSTHPATSALYINNFMRPLRPQEVQDYLVELATPPGAARNEDLILDFFLDAIKTHAFIVFATTSAASRVRAALHDRIWPDERNRKPLWVDYFPPEQFQGWVSQEEGHSGGRASGARWELEYTTTSSGQVEVKLVDAAERQQHQSRQRSMSPRSADVRRSSIPAAPAVDAYAGVQGAPTGPRNPANPRDRFRMNQQEQPSFDRRGPSFQRAPRNDMPETRTYPPVTFKPVARDLAKSRLDVIARAKSNHYDDRHLSGAAKEYRRYYFDDGDMLVDRGPEIFLGIRPPHRERERRREMGRNAGPPGGGYGRRGGGECGGRRRRRNGGGGGGGGRNGKFPMYHGVPRGGDRFRPSH